MPAAKAARLRRPRSRSPRAIRGDAAGPASRPLLRSGTRPARSEPLPATVELRLEGVVLDESSLASSPMLPYVRMVVSLIEGVEFTCREVVHLLRQTLRQHSIGARRRVDYLLGFLHRHPP